MIAGPAAWRKATSTAPNGHTTVRHEGVRRSSNGGWGGGAGGSGGGSWEGAGGGSGDGGGMVVVADVIGMPLL